MRIHYIKYITLSASLLAFTGCSNETDIANSNDGKQPIELSVGQDAPSTRAVITDGTGKTLNAFELATDIWMVMQSDYVALSSNNANPSDIDYKGSQTTTNCVTMGTTGAETSVGSKENVVNFTADNTRYWDDAHARSSALSIWAIAVPNKTGDVSKWGSKTAGSWNTTIEDKTIAWEVPAAQDATSMENKDLCFSNNIAETNMKYKTTPSPAFDKGKLIFYHALTKITVILKEGKGFDTSSNTDFQLDNITLNGFKLSGTFDVAQGEFSSQAESATSITSMVKTQDAEGKTITLQALVMPGRSLASDASKDAIVFGIDDNLFSVSAATLLEKLRAGNAGAEWTTFEAGNNYVFTFTINKTDIKLTATIAEWKDVTAKDETPLINVTTSYGQTGDNFGKGFSFLRSTTINNGYANDATVGYAESKYTMTPQLYWPNHSTHYFFRGVWPLIGVATDGSQTLSSNVSASAITVANGAYTKDTYPSDLMIGYPRTSTETCPHGNTVATSGICATEGIIRMNFQYVMSQVEVNLQTNTAEGATNKVNFDANTKVEIVGAYTNGTILLSNGSATMGTKADYTMNRKGASDVAYHDVIIPQNVTALKFRITVTDTDGKQDKYETVFAISEIKVTEDGVEKDITAWEPGKHYVYNLLITKTGIKVTATIKDWVTATGGTTIWM